MIEKITLRLLGFGYEMLEGDVALIEYLISKVEQDIKNATNLEEVPEGLSYCWVDGVCYEFLNLALSQGKIQNVDRIAKSIQEGDTTVSFDNELTPEARLLKAINALRITRSDTTKYRVMVW